jgi:hypothetical protein
LNMVILDNTYKHKKGNSRKTTLEAMTNICHVVHQRFI